jgi:type II restriction/modification system DNA methylase subunit YeeA
MDLTEFVAKWERSQLTERSASHQHFLDLCAVIGAPTPAGIDATGQEYTFERGAAKTGGGSGWADVWYRSHFGWEYKGKHANLAAAYGQLLQYREDLENPPLLVVCDMSRFEVHTNFTGTAKKVFAFTLQELARGRATANCILPPLEVLRALWFDPERLRPDQTAARVTEIVAAEFSRLADNLRIRIDDPTAIARFLIRLLFCLFAEDIGLLPEKLFSTLLERTRLKPDDFDTRLKELFAAMAGGGWFGVEDIRHFNGDLFSGAMTLPLTREDIGILRRAAQTDWSGIEPSIFGTLFERSLDPAKRAQLGAHYTGLSDILLVVEPVLMEPLRREWREVQSKAGALVVQRASLVNSKLTAVDAQLSDLLQTFAEKIASVRVLDPACGSGNFLYVALRQLLDLEKEVIVYATANGMMGFFPRVGPEQMHGIEINEYAHELAPITVNIGYIQWLRDNGFGLPPEPILKPRETVVLMDSLVAVDSEGAPRKPSWPEADVVIGNPPFLGGKSLRTDLGDEYVDALFEVYDGDVARESDLVCYFFERARELTAAGKVKRVGLLATNSIRGGANRRVLERIKESGDIFMAWADRPWVLDGAAVRISIVGFDDGSELGRYLDGIPVERINTDLTGTTDLTKAVPLQENEGIAFMGDTKGGPFDIDEATAREMLAAPINPNGRPNSDVVRPWINALDLTRRPRNMYIIDFGADMSESEAALYELPFEFVKKHVLPKRLETQRAVYRERWWIHVRPRSAMRTAIASLNRFIVTPGVAKHRLCTWQSGPTLPDHALFVFARSDDYFFGIVQSHTHGLWSLALGSWLGVGNDLRYTPESTFATFPLPWPPGLEPVDDPVCIAIASAAKDLVAKRDSWLNPAGADEAQLRSRTLTNLYNENPTWLQQAHRRLDLAVYAAYGWLGDISDHEVLERLLELNASRVGQSKESS